MLSEEAWNLLFNEARSHNDFDPTPVPDDTLKALYDANKKGQTSAKSTPAR